MPTLYEVIGIPHPKEVDGFEQAPMDGVSLAYTFATPHEPARKKVQYFENGGAGASTPTDGSPARSGPSLRGIRP